MLHIQTHIHNMTYTYRKCDIHTYKHTHIQTYTHTHIQTVTYTHTKEEKTYSYECYINVYTFKIICIRNVLTRDNRDLSHHISPYFTT